MVAASRWLRDVYDKALRLMPPELADRLSPAEVFHQVLEHRWFLSELAGRDVGTTVAARSYFDEVLPTVPEELVSVGTVEIAPGSEKTPGAGCSTTTVRSLKALGEQPGHRRRVGEVRQSGVRAQGAEIFEAVATCGDQQAVCAAGLCAFEVPGRVPDHPRLLRRQIEDPSMRPGVRAQ